MAENSAKDCINSVLDNLWEYIENSENVTPVIQRVGAAAQEYNV